MESPGCSSMLPDKKQKYHLLPPCLANRSTCILSVLFVLTLVIALSALLVSAAALLVSCHHNKEFSPQDDQKWEDTTFRYNKHGQVHAAGLERMDLPSNQKERRDVDNTDKSIGKWLN